MTIPNRNAWNRTPWDVDVHLWFETPPDTYESLDIIGALMIALHLDNGKIIYLDYVDHNAELDDMLYDKVQIALSLENLDKEFILEDHPDQVMDWNEIYNHISKVVVPYELATEDNGRYSKVEASLKRMVIEKADMDIPYWELDPSLFQGYETNAFFGI